MYEHQEKKIAFIAHPRTASSAIGHTLLNMGFVIREDHHAFDSKWNLDGWDVICTVRNPLDVMVSWFYNKPREKPFDRWLPEFLEGCHYLQGSRMFFGQPYATHVMHFEYLQIDFDRVTKQLGLPKSEIPQRNVSTNRKVKGLSFPAYYDARLTKMVVDRFIRDFTKNGYGIYVKQGSKIRN